MAGSNTFGGTIKLEGEKQYRAAIRRLETSQSLKYSQIGDIFNFYVHFCVTTKTNQKASREDFDSSRTLLNDAKGTPLETRRTTVSACVKLEIAVRFLEDARWLSENISRK